MGEMNVYKHTTSLDVGGGKVNNISIPFPLSDGTLARLYAPPVVTIEDAKRMKRMINALYINGDKEIE